MARKKSEDTVEESNKKQLSSKEILSDFLNEYEGEHFCNVIPENKPIRFGSLRVDKRIRIRSGSVVRLCGKGAELGKTSQSFVLADNFMKVYPKSKTIYIKAEARLTPEMQARSGMKFVTKAEDWDYGTVFVFPCNTFEVVADKLERMLLAMYQLGEKLCFIIDSLDGLALRDDKKKAIWDEKGDNVKVAGVALLTKLLFKRIGLQITHYDALGIILGQYSAPIKLNQYDTTPRRQAETSGGSSIAHQSDYVLQYLLRDQGDYIWEGPEKSGKILGVNAWIEIKKSATDVTGEQIDYPVQKNKVGNCIWIEREILGECLYWGLVEKKGAWFKIKDNLKNDIVAAGLTIEDQYQGENKFVEAFENNANLTEFMYNKFCELIYGKDS